MADRLEEKRLREALDIATNALRTHRSDMHESSSRPCSTCAQSSKALAVADMVRIWHDDRRAARASEARASARPPCPECAVSYGAPHGDACFFRTGDPDHLKDGAS